MIDAPFPLWFAWTDEGVMRPLNPKTADRIYVVGERYHLEHHEDRSMESHRHYFSAISEVWQNLPPNAAERFSSPEHLRKWALIKSGFRDERSFICASKAEAQRLAAFLRPIDDFAVVSVNGTAVVMLTAKSQNMRAMNRKTFTASKTAVLDVLAELIGTTPEMLGRSAA